VHTSSPCAVAVSVLQRLPRRSVSQRTGGSVHSPPATSVPQRREQLGWTAAAKSQVAPARPRPTESTRYPLAGTATGASWVLYKRARIIPAAS